MKKHDYPNPSKKKIIFNDATQIFKEIAMQEDNKENLKANLKELLQLLTKEDDVRQLVDVFNILKNQSKPKKKIKNICHMNQVDKCDLDPQVDL